MDLKSEVVAEDKSSPIVQLKAVKPGTNRRLVLEILADNYRGWLSVQRVLSLYPNDHAVFQSTHPTGYVRAILNRLAGQGLVKKMAIVTMMKTWVQSPYIYQIKPVALYNVWYWWYCRLVDKPKAMSWERVVEAIKNSPLQKPPYVRLPALDLRIANGDDFAGDAWCDIRSKKVRYVAVGYEPYQDKEYDDWRTSDDLRRVFHFGPERLVSLI